MYDVAERSKEATYECMKCGELVTATQRPGTCPSCEESGTFQHRGMSLE